MSGETVKEYVQWLLPCFKSKMMAPSEVCESAPPCEDFRMIVFGGAFIVLRFEGSKVGIRDEVSASRMWRSLSTHLNFEDIYF